MLLKDLILKQDDLKTKEIAIEEWKDQDGVPLVITIRQFSAQARDDWETSLYNKKGDFLNKNLRARFCVLGILGDDGELAFTESDAVELGKKSAKALEFIYSEIQELNKSSSIESMEEETKN